jgi:hypothetical protein
MDKIYELKLHESCTAAGDYVVTRVPGGWLYYKKEMYSNGDTTTAVCTFVPISNEYKEAGL